MARPLQTDTAKASMESPTAKVISSKKPIKTSLLPLSITKKPTGSAGGRLVPRASRGSRLLRATPGPIRLQRRERSSVLVLPRSFARRRTANYSPTADLDQGRFYHASSYHVKGFCPGTHSNSLAQTTIRPFSVEYSQVDRVSSFSPYSGTMFRRYRDISSISAMPSSNSSFVAGSRKR